MVDGDETIAYLTASPTAAGLVMDFDGVLAPIIDTPDQSRLLDGTAATRPLPAWRLHAGTVERATSCRVDLDVDLGQTLDIGHGPVPL